MNVSKRMHLIPAVLLCALVAPHSANAQSKVTVPVQIVVYPAVSWPGPPHPIPPIISLAILSSDTFDARRVDPESLTLSGVPPTLSGKGKKSQCKEGDANRDGRLDLVCQIQIARVNTRPTRFVVLEGNTSDGIFFRGEVPLPGDPGR